MDTGYKAGNFIKEGLIEVAKAIGSVAHELNGIKTVMDRSRRDAIDAKATTDKLVNRIADRVFEEAAKDADV